MGHCDLSELVIEQLELALNRKIQASESIEAALQSEHQALILLNHMRQADHLEGLTQHQIAQAKQDVFLAAQREEHSLKDLQHSIAGLQAALASLDQEHQPPAAADNPKALLRRADINTDGIVDVVDFTVLTHFWLNTFHIGDD